jgi:hypothetical protein
MQPGRRWREWQKPEKFCDLPEHELTKPTEALPEAILSVLAVAPLAESKRNEEPASIPPHNPAELHKPFNRWREWLKPEKFSDPSENELTEPTETPPEAILSVLAVAPLAESKRNEKLASIPPHDPAEWRKPFSRWRAAACVRSSRAFGSVTSLHLAYCDWEVRQGGVPCTRPTFDLLLQECGILIDEVAGVELAVGLTFLEDFKTAGRDPGRVGECRQV